ncbi:MAG: pyridoxal phosphate-dependent aminotransferase [Candidatus Abyssobacteria bacterium SURF_17]|uniref:Aminotransferase n=1 Tax=Candidatus Abyssobacteria bacterium SURF_17 TaxID=2093361 RepID=A0A419F5L1_9BACT|nr:MAG: pyridoxal phosphate-dependent aminotransferase [Candidatus Abyssubacteria bacterium SURF_17]
MLARRMKLIDSSGIRKVFDLAAKLKDPINLSIGQPDFDIPDEIKEIGIQSIREGFNRYTVTQGIPELREAVREHYRRKYSVEFEDTLITSGVSGGLLLAFMALIEEGDEVLLPDPYFVMYKHLANLLGGKPVFVNTYPDFTLAPEKLEEKVTKRTKMLVINSPANPTGRAYSSEELRSIAEFARKHNLLVVTDEIYDHFIYDQTPDTFAKYYEKTLLLNGFSKSSAMTGWRLGYAAGPREIIESMKMLQQYSFVCAPSFAQKAGLAALDLDITQHIADYRSKRDLIYEGLKGYFDVEKPGGAFYIFPKAPGDDGVKFVEKAIANNLLIIPGNVFSERNTHFRISFAAPDETILRGIEVLQKLAKQF